MKTIEERAKEYADKESRNIFLDSTDELYKKMLYEDYVKIATEQKRVDIDRVCEWLEKNLPNTTMEDIINGVPTGCNRDAIIEKFRKDIVEEN